MPSTSAKDLADRMNVVGSEVQRTIRAGRKAGLTSDAAVLAALIGVLSVIRVDGLNEEAILRDAKRAVPHRIPADGIMQVRS